MNRQRHSRNEKNACENGHNFFSNIAALFIKQTAAALICAIVVWTMHNAGIPELKNCANALNEALSQEFDLSELKRKCEIIFQPDSSIKKNIPQNNDATKITEH